MIDNTNKNKKIDLSNGQSSVEYTTPLEIAEYANTLLPNTTFSNGLVKTSNDVALGGTITVNSEIGFNQVDRSLKIGTYTNGGIADNHYIEFKSGSVEIVGNQGFGTSLKMSSLGLKVNIPDANNGAYGFEVIDARPTKKGITYAGDYSSSFDNNSLVSKLYVDNSIYNNVRNTVTAPSSNGSSVGLVDLLVKNATTKTITAKKLRAGTNIVLRNNVVGDDGVITIESISDVNIIVPITLQGATNASSGYSSFYSPGSIIQPTISTLTDKHRYFIDTDPSYAPLKMLLPDISTSAVILPTLEWLVYVYNSSGTSGTSLTVEVSGGALLINNSFNKIYPINPIDSSGNLVTANYVSSKSLEAGGIYSISKPFGAFYVISRIN
jgi:hypothetical protein